MKRLFLPGHGKSGMIRPVKNNESLEEQHFTWKQKFRKASILVKTDFEDSFSDSYILKWSLWWALGSLRDFRRKIHVSLFHLVSRNVWKLPSGQLHPASVGRDQASCGQ